MKKLLIYLSVIFAGSAPFLESQALTDSLFCLNWLRTVATWQTTHLGPSKSDISKILQTIRLGQLRITDPAPSYATVQKKMGTDNPNPRDQLRIGNRIFAIEQDLKDAGDGTQSYAIRMEGEEIHAFFRSEAGMRRDFWGRREISNGLIPLAISHFFTIAIAANFVAKANWDLLWVPAYAVSKPIVTFVTAQVSRAINNSSDYGYLFFRPQLELNGWSYSGFRRQFNQSAINVALGRSCQNGTCTTQMLMDQLPWGLKELLGAHPVGNAFGQIQLYGDVFFQSANLAAGKPAELIIVIRLKNKQPLAVQSIFDFSLADFLRASFPVERLQAAR